MSKQDNINNMVENGTPVILQPVTVSTAKAAPTAIATSSIDITTRANCSVISGGLLPLNTTLLQNGIDINHQQGDQLVYLEGNSSYLCNYFTTGCYAGGASCVQCTIGLLVNGENFPGTLCSASLQKGQSATLSGSCIINTGNTGVLTAVGIKNRSPLSCWFQNTSITVVKIG